MKETPGSPSEKPSLWKIWVLASRPHTLTASVSPVLTGHVLCTLHTSSSDSCPISRTLQWLAFCLCIQLGTNLHNDYADFILGADNEDRIGQARATQKGWLTPSQTATGASVCLIAALSIGWPLTSLNPSHGSIDWKMLFVILSSVFNAVAYTGGPYPLGCIGLGSVSIAYSGLGDLFAFLYFGCVATLTVPYLCNGVISAENFIFSLPVGFFATAIIIVNNLRDRFTDVKVNKRTVAVRFGGDFCRVEYATLIIAIYLVGIFYKFDSYWRLLPLLSLPIAVEQMRAVVWEKDGADLNPHVGGTAKLQLMFCVLYCGGLYMSDTSIN